MGSDRQDCVALDWGDPRLDGVLAEHISAFLSKGESALLDPIVRVTEPRLRAYLQLRCPDLDPIDDLVQETYLRSFGSLDRLDKPLRFRGFLFGVARNVAREHYRKSARDLRLVDRYQKEMAPVLAKISEPVSQEPGGSVASKQEALNFCLDRLPQDRRQLLTQRYVEGIGADQLSKDSHLSPGGVRTLLHRLRLQVQDCVRLRLSSASQS